MRSRIKKGRKNWLFDSLKYIRESKNYIYSTIFLFLIGGFIGFLVPGYFEEYFLEVIRELIEKTQGLNAFEMILFIFWNNLTSAFVSIISGVLLGVIPIISILVNGVLLGFVMNKAIAVEGIFTIWRLMPHGIFELPAIFIAVGLGIKLGTFWLSGKGNMKKEFFRRLITSLKVFATVVLPLLIIAAIIEGLLIAVSG